MKYYVYILLCDKNTYYIGLTRNLEKRLDNHKNKKSKYTKIFKEIKFVFFEEYKTKQEASKREKQLKGWSSAKKRALIENNKNLLINLSRSAEVVEKEEG